ncbi:MAG: TonB-dependent receptor [Sphingobacteriaceae bacterium]|jgi:outer membrane receptor protein involved in Fe transport|nr:TonB-dependent receptor [Sphingobacteriaceae bacterium]
MKKFLLIAIALLSFQFSIAQTGSVKGIVVDEQSKSPLDYASIALLKTSDSTVVAGTLANEKGEFTLSKIAAGTYSLKAVFIGYETKYVRNITVSGGQLNLGQILLKPGSKLLNEVTVTGQQINALNKIDKQTYRADQFQSAKGGSAIDVLKNLPSVSVNGEGEISVRGATGFLVLVNGKPVLTDAQTVLSQLPANALENIELITAPSAKYDPDGKAGIINIVTKKGANDGLSLAANAMVGLPSTTDYGNTEQPQRYGADLTLNMRKKSWDVSVGGNYTRNDNAGYREGEVYTKNLANNTITRFPSNGERSFDKYNYAGRASVVYTPNASNSISAGFFAGKRFQSRLADILYTNSTSNLNTNALIKSTTYFNSNLQTKQGNFTLGNLDYTHTFKNKSTLTASGLYEKASLYGNTNNRNLKYPVTGQMIQQVFNPYENPIEGYRLKLDHSVPLGKGKLESGYQFRYDTQNGTFDYSVNPATSQTDIARFRGTAKAKNVINSVYSQYSGKADKLQYVAGLRYEIADREVDLSYDPNKHLLNLSNLFPSANLLYTFNPSWSAKAGYSKRVQRNNNYELNPIPEREHSETLEQGDPDLLPQFVDLAELGINHTFSSGSFFSTFYFQNIKNPIQRVNSVYADTILNRVFTNAEKARLFGFEAGTNIKPAKWWSLYLGTNIYNYKINGNLNILGVASSISNSDWAYSINANSSFDLGAKWTFQGNVNYLSERPTAQGKDSRFLIPNTSLKKTFGDGRFSAMLQWQNMNLGFMDANKQRITTSGANFYTTTNYIYETDVFLLNLSFNLNKLSGKAKLPTSEIGDKEF